MHNASSYPGPPCSLVTGHLRDLQRHPLGFLQGAARNHGDIVFLRFVHRCGILVSHPELIEALFVHQQKWFEKTSSESDAGGIFGRGIFTAQNDEWRQQRRIIAPAFTPRAVKSYAVLLAEETEKRLERLQDGDRIDLKKLLSDITLSAVARALFGKQEGAWLDGIRDALEEVLNRFREEFPSPTHLTVLFPESFPFPRNLRLRQAVRTIRGLVQSARIKAEINGVETPLLIAIKDSMNDRQAPPFSETVYRDLCITLLLTGYETTVSALCWTFYLLDGSPVIEAHLRDEVQEACRGALPAPDQVHNLPFARRIIDESLRLFPPAWGINRRSREDCALGEVLLKRGMFVAVSQWVVHRDPRWWVCPETFDPDRWSASSKSARPRFCYFPFGGGNRVCLGRDFALLQILIVLATIVRKYRFGLYPDRPLEPELSITLRPRGRIWAKVDKLTK